MTTFAPVSPGEAPSAPGPDQTWAALAPVIAARPTMRLWSPQRRFADTRRLTTKTPDRPAAVPIFRRGRTRLLVFDLDAKLHGPAAVAADRQRILNWLNTCRARAIVDHSTSGGSHILVPLAGWIGPADLEPLLAAITQHCPTLDTSPMLNPATGCITVPGSPCREGGHRQLLDQDVDTALTVLAAPNPTGLVAALVEQIGAPASADLGTMHTQSPGAPIFSGSGADTALLDRYRRRGPIPAPVLSFATTGRLPAHRRWDSRSEARMSVLVHAMWTGHTLNDVRAAIQPGQPWHHGLGAAYHRYGAHADTSLQRDWVKARTWIEAAAVSVQPRVHKNQEHTGGAGTHRPSRLHHRWLADALWWCDIALRSSPRRWVVAAVLQALAISAVRAGEVVNSVPVVAVGGRSLSIAAGLISESSVWSALRLLRDTPGSPVLLVAHGSGLNADRYALVTPDVKDRCPHQHRSLEVADVHPVWATIGLQYRRLYEVVQRGTTAVPQIADDARVSRSSAYDGVAELCRVGLLRRDGRRVKLTDTTLDTLADQLAVAEHRAARIAAHRQARARWRDWLQTRQQPVIEPASRQALPDPGPLWSAWDDSGPTGQEYLAAVLATGPPSGC